MAITHPLAVRQSRTDHVVDKLDLGTTDATGDLVLLTSGDVVIATMTLSNPAFGAADGAATATAGTITDDTNAVGGTAAKYAFRDRDNVQIILGSVTAVGGGGDMELNTVTVPAAATVSITSATYNAGN